MSTVLQNNNILALHNPRDLKLTQFFSKVEIYLSFNIFQDAEAPKKPPVQIAHF